MAHAPAADPDTTTIVNDRSRPLLNSYVDRTATAVFVPFMIASFGNLTLVVRVEFPKLAIMVRLHLTFWTGACAPPDSKPVYCRIPPPKGQGGDAAGRRTYLPPVVAQGHAEIALCSCGSRS